VNPKATKIGDIGYTESGIHNLTRSLNGRAIGYNKMSFHH